MRRFISRIVVSISIVAATIVFTQSAQAQMFTVLHNFTGGQDGANPIAGLTMDRAGNFYGTTTYGGNSGYGTVYKLIRKGSAWTFNPLYSFTGGADGRFPSGRVTIGSDGSLYGLTERGGENGCVQAGGCGVVFNLRPPARACKTTLCPWMETVLYRFSGNSDGWSPLGDLIFDETGNLYGIASAGGYYGGACSSAGYGVVFELIPSHGNWTQSVLYTFTDGNDGADPEAGLMFDKAGNLYSTTNQGGVYGFGTVFQLMLSGSVWTENTLHSFQRELDGFQPKYSGVISDQFGNLYGTTDDGGLGGGGTVYELTPQGGGWTFNVLYSFSGNGGPVATLAMDAAGNLYDTTLLYGAYGYGSVFKLAPQPGGSWTLSSLYDFTGGNDGSMPLSSVALDANGSLYGTAYGGGAYGYGVVWEITP
jgi:uncharacterized repeat protein (TIGR03803 family)